MSLSVSLLPCPMHCESVKYGDCASQFQRWTGWRVRVAVGTTIADRPPRRSVRARLRIRLLLWMNGGETHCWPHIVQSLGHALPALCRTHV